MRTCENDNVYGFANGSKVIHSDIVEQIMDYFYVPPEEDAVDDDEYSEEELEFHDACLVFYPNNYCDKIDYEKGCFLRPKGYYLQYKFKEGVLLCDSIDFETSSLFNLLKDNILIENLSEPEELDEKIVKKGSKWQVQSEKGRNMGTYDTKAEAEERLKQVHYFKYVNESSRSTLISKSKGADKYANGKGSR